MLVVAALITSCAAEPIVNSGNSVQGAGAGVIWSIPKDKIVDGGVGEDGIPSLDDPKYYNFNDVTYIGNNELVIGVVIDGQARAYPHKILDWHEIVNDDFGKSQKTVSYCPLTGTAMGWECEISGHVLDFGVSGLLYNANLILYDRQTKSRWSQLSRKCVNGELLDTEAVSFPVLETTWGMWKRMYPNTIVLSDIQGYNFDYSFYPYGSYRWNNNYFIFPVDNLDTRLGAKERVLVLYYKQIARVYRFESFGGGKVVKQQFFEKHHLIAGTPEVMVAYELAEDQLHLEFELMHFGRAFLKDNEGNTWSLGGVALSGPRKGQKLVLASSYMSYWFAVPPFFNWTTIIDVL